MKPQFNSVMWNDLAPGLEIGPIEQLSEFDWLAQRLGQVLLQHYVEYPPRIGSILPQNTLDPYDPVSVNIAERFDDSNIYGPNLKALFIASAKPIDPFRIHDTENRFLSIAGSRGSYHVVETVVFLRLEKSTPKGKRISAQKQVGEMQNITTLAPYVQRRTDSHSSQPRGATQGVSWDDLKLPPKLG